VDQPSIPTDPKALPHRRQGRRSGDPPAEHTSVKPTVRSFFTDDNHVPYHLWTLICGLSLVMPLCLALIRKFPLQFRYEPTGIGIISVTTLSRQPPNQELYCYVLALAVLIVVPGLVWLAWLVFSLSLTRVLDRDFGTVATRGCWATGLFVVVFPFASLYAWLSPVVTFALLAATAATAAILQVALVLALPQRFDRELDEVRWPAWDRLTSPPGPRKMKSPVARLVGVARHLLLPSRVAPWLARAFIGGVAVSWVLFVILSGSVKQEGLAVELMALLVLALPVLFVAGWVAMCRRWTGERHRGGVHFLLVVLAGLALAWYLYFVVKDIEVMLSAATLVAGLLLADGLRERLAAAPKWLRALAVGTAVVIVVVLLALVTFQPGFLSESASLNSDFLREDGSHLAWANAILHGKLQGRDFYSMYGPLLHYGLVAMMKVVGVTAEAAPLYWWVGRAAGAVALVLLLWELTGSVAFAVFAVAVLHPGVGLRTAPALAALAAFIHFARTRRPFWALVTGLLIGLALALSHEFGLCALLACGAATAVLAWRYETRRLAGAGLAALLLGVMLALAPVVAHFAVAGALGDLVRDLVQHPRYVLMGYGNLPFPHRLSLLAQDRPLWQVVAELLRGDPLRWYFPIVAWVVTLHLVLFRYVMGKATARDLGALSVAVFGILAYRTALARSDVVHLYLIMPVAMVLFLWHVWLLLGRLLSVLARVRLRVVNVVEFGALLATAVFLVNGATLKGMRVAVLPGQVARAVRDAARIPAHLRAPSQLERSKVPPGRTNVVAELVDYVREHTSPLEPVLAVPNVPVFYFLADRLNPTRFAAMAQLVTNEHRIEALRELQQQLPSLVLFHGGDNDIDNIPPTRQFPNVLNFILTRYAPVAKFGPLYVLARAPADRVPAATWSWKAGANLDQWSVHGDSKRVSLESEGAYRTLAGNRPVTLTIDLDGLPGQGYRTLRVHVRSQARGTMQVQWLTREPLDTDEDTQATLALPATRGQTQTADLDLRDYPSWLFNHVRRLSLTIPARCAVTVEAIELLPVGLGPEEPRPSSAPAPPSATPVKEHP